MYRQRRHISVEDTISLGGGDNNGASAEVRRQDMSAQVSSFSHFIDFNVYGYCVECARMKMSPITDLTRHKEFQRFSSFFWRKSCSPILIEI